MEKNKPIQLTEQDLHMLVEDSVRTYLKENGMEEGIWGGLKNVASGMRQGNFFIGQNYKYGKLVTSYNKYAQNVYATLTKMYGIAEQLNNQNLAANLKSWGDAIVNSGKNLQQNLGNLTNNDMTDRYKQGMQLNQNTMYSDPNQEQA